MTTTESTRGITQESVFAAAAALVADGAKPTVAAVRERLGTGSATTISNHLREWRTTQGNAASATSSPDIQIPESLTDVVNAAQGVLQETLGKFWINAESLANSRLSQERESLQSERKQAMAELDEALQRLESLRADLTQQVADAKRAAATAVAQFEQEKRRADFLEQHLSEQLSDVLRKLEQAKQADEPQPQQQ